MNGWIMQKWKISSASASSWKIAGSSSTNRSRMNKIFWEKIELSGERNILEYLFWSAINCLCIRWQDAESWFQRTDKILITQSLCVYNLWWGKGEEWQNERIRGWKTTRQQDRGQKWWFSKIFFHCLPDEALIEWIFFLCLTWIWIKWSLLISPNLEWWFCWKIRATRVKRERRDSWIFCRICWNEWMDGSVFLMQSR